MQRRIFSREYKLEAVKLVKERGVAVAQAARDRDVHENVLRKWVREYGSDPAQSFPGKGQMKPEQLEIERLRREVAKLKAERDIVIMLERCSIFARRAWCFAGRRAGKVAPVDRQRERSIKRSSGGASSPALQTRHTAFLSFFSCSFPDARIDRRVAF